MTQGTHTRPASPAWRSRWSRRRILRLLTRLSVVTTLLLVTATGAGYALLGYYDGNTTRLPGVIEPSAAAVTDDDVERPLNILIVGSDSREGLVG